MRAELLFSFFFGWGRDNFFLAELRLGPGQRGYSWHLPFFSDGVGHEIDMEDMAHGWPVR